LSIIKIVSHKLANYIVSATLDTQTEGCFKSPTDVDELKNSFFFSATLNQCNLSLVTNHYILSFFIASIDESIPYGSFGHCRALPTPFRQSGTNYARAIKKEWRKKIPLSKLCHAHVISLLHNPMKDSTIYLLVQTNWEKCTHSVTLHLSDSEYDTLTKRANGSPLSRYIRSILLYRSETIHIEVYTEEISILTCKCPAIFKDSIVLLLLWQFVGNYTKQIITTSSKSPMTRKKPFVMLPTTSKPTVPPSELLEYGFYEKKSKRL